MRRAASFRSWNLSFGLAAWLGVMGASSGSAAPAVGVEFNRDIRPLLSDNCFQCHGPDLKQLKGKLRLDLREEAVKAGVIVPGQPDESELIARIFTTDEEDLMPPPSTHKTLSEEDKEMLRRWIEQGAEYQPHWAYIAPTRPNPPEVKNKVWGRNAVDAFILAKLEERSHLPSPEADRRTLLRRLSLDLTGLPPTPEEVRDFLMDHSAGAYERQVERLLQSPHYGERMAAPWLDLARFADTVGYHGDQVQNIFPYRDYVISAFNRNKPFDQFTIEQIAGDLLPNPTLEQRVATGFNRLNMMTREGGAQPEEYLAKYAADRVRTVSTAWLGSTMACAECHDHKYDPFSASDFYRFAAFFSDIKQWGVYNDYPYTPNPDLRGWSNDHPFPPEIEVPSPYLKERLRRLRTDMEELVGLSELSMRAGEEKRAAFAEWSGESAAFLREHSSGWLRPVPEPAVVGKDDAAFQVREDRSVLLTGKTLSSAQVKLTLPQGWVSALKLELIPTPEHGGSVLRGGARSTTLRFNMTHRSGADGKETRLTVYHAEADRKEERYANGETILGVRDGWRTSSEFHQTAQHAVYLLDQPLRAQDGDTLTVSLGGSPVGCVRLSISPFGMDDPLIGVPGAELRLALQAEPDQRTLRQRSLLAKAYLLGTGWDGKTFAQFQRLHREALACRDGRAWTMVTEAGTPAVTRVLPRGNWQDESGEVVDPGPPRFLPQPAGPDGRRMNRLDLARWLVSAENPLTARTFVNRLWKQFFGSGISAVVDDLGAQGEWPSHPELLDWLALEFRESGWNMKQMVRLMVTSSTYRQASSLRPELQEMDPNNRLLASQNPRRLEAELVRDNALFVAGLLNQELGGPSVFPYQPAGYYVNLQFPDRDYHSSRDDRQYRRGVYSHWQRTFLHPMLANFDAPSREECIAYRMPSNTPQQALTLLNDPSFVEAARVFAEMLLSGDSQSDEHRLGAAFERALARGVRPAERESLLRFLKEQRAHYQAARESADQLLSTGLAGGVGEMDPVELAAWTQVCRVVLNLHETITVY